MKYVSIISHPFVSLSLVLVVGILRVKKDPQTGLELVYPRSEGDNSYDQNDLLQVVYDCKPIQGVWDNFETIRTRVHTQWNAAPKQHDPISKELQTKIREWRTNQMKLLEQVAP